MAKITHSKSSTNKEVAIEMVTDEDYKKITKTKFFFNWKTEKDLLVYKLRLSGSHEIIGLISLLHYPEEQRFQINLLSVSKENRGNEKEYDGIAGNLIAHACREALKL